MLRHASHSNATRLRIATLLASIAAICPVGWSQAPQTPAQSSSPSPSQNPAPAETPTAYAAGVVHTVDGSPVPGASLRLVNTDTRKAFVSWTDESGKFQLAFVAGAESSKPR